MNKNKRVFCMFGVSLFGVLFMMNIAVLPLNRELFFINTGVLCVLIVLVVTVFRHYRNHMSNVCERVRKLITDNTIEILDGVKAPVAIIHAGDEELLFYNSSFERSFVASGKLPSLLISDYLPSEKMGAVLSQEYADVSYQERKFRVFAYKVDDFIVFYFSDETQYKNLWQKYVNSRPCVGLVLFDNKEDLKSNMDEESMLRISVTVENMLYHWVKGTGGFMNKTGDGKYLMVFEEKYLKGFVKEKFKIIDKIHTAKADDGRFATVSIGISRGAEGFEEAKTWAKNALDMALGRGGDQVSVKNNKSYEFFGGSSKEIAKRSKVRTRVSAMALLEKIEDADSIFLMGHKFSDFDSIGAALGLWSVCAGFKKKSTYIVVNKAQSLAGSAIDHVERSGLSNVFITPSQAVSRVTENSLLIIVDTHSVKFSENTDLTKLVKNIAVVDHHRLSADKITDATLFFHEPFASSACEMVTEMIQYMGDKNLKKAIAECLLAGIMLDTKSFSLKSGVRTFEAAAYLKRKGADSAEVKKMFANTLESYQIKSQIITNAKIIEGCALSRCEWLGGDLRIPAAQAADELLNIKNVKASFVLFPGENGVGISARSAGDINVQVIMEAMGGGGHQTMAATQISDTDLNSVEESLKKIIKTSLNEIKNRTEKC